MLARLYTSLSMNAVRQVFFIWIEGVVWDGQTETLEHILLVCSWEDLRKIFSAAYVLYILSFFAENIRCYY